MTWTESEPLLSAYDVPVPETALATSPEAAATPADEIGYPAVLKIESADVPHRTDIDAVLVGLEDADAVRRAFKTIDRNVRESDCTADVEGFSSSHRSPRASRHCSASPTKSASVRS